MVEAARIAYRDYPTVVNEIGESGLSYDNTMEEYARMDSFMQSAQKAIGGSSDTAQLAQSYYWDKVAKNEIDDDCKQYYDNTVILAVLAQVAIDGCKRQFEINVNDDIARVRNQPCMKREKDYPEFMKWTREIPLTKNGKDRNKDDIRRDKNNIKKRIDEDIVCPMNWLQDCLDKIQGANKNSIIETHRFLTPKPVGKVNSHHVSKIRTIIEEYDGFTKNYMLQIQDGTYDDMSMLIEKTEEVLEKIRGINLTIFTIYRLIETSLGIEGSTRNEYKYKDATKYTRKMMSTLYKTNKDKFLSCFIEGNGYRK